MLQGFIGAVALFATIVYPGQAEAVTPRQEKSALPAFHEKDVVSYVHHRFELPYIHRLLLQYEGLKDIPKLDKLVSQQNYREVLHNLWTEKDLEKRIAWLEAKVSEGHPILMFELGYTYFERAPQIETYLGMTKPWFQAAARVAALDGRCTSDPTVKLAIEELCVTYSQPAEAELQKLYSYEEIETYTLDHLLSCCVTNVGIHRRVLSPFVKGQRRPSPEWIFYHGQDALTGKKNLIPIRQWDSIRKEQAWKFLKEAEEFLQQMKDDLFLQGYRKELREKMQQERAEAQNQ